MFAFENNSTMYRFRSQISQILEINTYFCNSLYKFSFLVIKIILNLLSSLTRFSTNDVLGIKQSHVFRRVLVILFCAFCLIRKSLCFYIHVKDARYRHFGRLPYLIYCGFFQLISQSLHLILTADGVVKKNVAVILSYYNTDITKFVPT